VGSMLLILTSRAFYATDLFRGIVWSQLAVLVVYAPLAVLLRSAYGATGLATAFGFAELVGGIVAVGLVARVVHMAGSDARPLLAVVYPTALAAGALAVIRIVVDRAPLSESSAAVCGAVLGGAALVVIVSVFLLRSDWPEAAVFRRRLRALRSVVARVGPSA
jgi:peptidoglycan biosynthesis protein MviN/MurJ (putative lipid II flippase)